MKVTVLGAGAWGTALAKYLALGGHDTTLWGRAPERLAEIQRTGRNDRCLPGIDLPRVVNLEPELDRAIRDVDAVVVAVPSKAFREVTQHLSGFGGLVVSVTKGIEYDTGLTMCGILAETAPQSRRAALSGPTFAIEVARDIPTAITGASEDSKIALQVQEIFSGPALRVYTSTDLRGVELGGALKNVIAVAAGVSDGLGFGDNSKASLVTRAIVEIRRLGVACGAQADTFTGLSGLGDLMVTCFSRLSRNRGFGERVGRGETPAEIAASTTAVAEGFPTARSARRLARQRGVSTPVIDEVYAMLYEAKNPARAVRDLLSREPKAEDR